MSLLVKSLYPKINLCAKIQKTSYEILKKYQSCIVLSGAETLGRIPIQPLHCMYVCVSKKDASPLQRAPQVQNG
ncbi:hypothetical protein NQ317_009565 [Molorchus minor]|uniref:Uncharacterized protein n=1 Tax=Molorchus minor TaxID=1323400 RepID=A0ABQ9IPU6_9CUCU|nr:hypothetical protein NQ317_009565 [Molorchus minor]